MQNGMSNTYIIGRLLLVVVVMDDDLPIIYTYVRNKNKKIQKSIDKCQKL